MRLHWLVMSVFLWFGQVSANESWQQQFLSLSYLQKPIHLRLNSDAYDTTTLQQILQTAMAEQELWWQDWRHNLRLQNQINTALAVGEGVAFSSDVESYLRHLQQLAINSNYAFNPLLLGLQNGHKLRRNNKPLRFDQVVFMPNGLLSTNRNIRFNLNITQSAYLLVKLTQLLQQLGISEWVIAYDDLVTYQGNSYYLHTLQQPELLSITLCPGETFSLRRGQRKVWQWQGQSYLSVLPIDQSTTVATAGVVAKDVLAASAYSYALLASDKTQQLAKRIGITNYFYSSNSDNNDTDMSTTVNQNLPQQSSLCS